MERLPLWLWILAGLALFAVAGGGALIVSRLVKNFEGLKLQVYQDEAGLWTVGYGHLIGPSDDLYPYTDVREISQADADRFLAADMREARDIVATYVRVPLTANQREALVSFVFNVGPGDPGVRDGFVWLKSGQASTMLRKLNARDYAGAAAAFDAWVYVKGNKSNGLIARRADERALFEAA